MWPRPLNVSADVVLIAVRIVLAWIFIYYGAGKLFAWFHGPGLHATSLFMAHSAHLHPGLLFAVLGGVIEFAGGICAGLGLASRLAGLALFCDQVMAMITVTWSNGINSLSNSPGYEFNMTLAVLALTLAVLGAGRASVDATLAHQFRGRTAAMTSS
jgi:putative oxidoreductase